MNLIVNLYLKTKLTHIRNGKLSLSLTASRAEVNCWWRYFCSKAIKACFFRTTYSITHSIICFIPTFSTNSSRADYSSCNCWSSSIFVSCWRLLYLSSQSISTRRSIPKFLQVIDLLSVIAKWRRAHLLESSV